HYTTRPYEGERKQTCRVYQADPRYSGTTLATQRHRSNGVTATGDSWLRVAAEPKRSAYHSSTRIEISAYPPITPAIGRMGRSVSSLPISAPHQRNIRGPCGATSYIARTSTGSAGPIPSTR